MSMKPGATTRPRASISALPRPGTTPTAAMRSPRMATSPATAGAPVPSTMEPPRSTRSQSSRTSWQAENDSRSAAARKRRFMEVPLLWNSVAAAPGDFRIIIHLSADKRVYNIHLTYGSRVMAETEVHEKLARVLVRYEAGRIEPLEFRWGTRDLSLASLNTRSSDPSTRPIKTF